MSLPTEPEFDIQEERITYNLEKYRAIFAGMTEMTVSNLAIIYLIRKYSIGAFEKGLITASPMVGYFLSPLLKNIYEKLGLCFKTAASISVYLSALFFFLAAYSDQQIYITLFVTAGIAFAATCVNFMTAIYEDNYRSDRRGRLFGTTNSIRILSGAIFGGISGWIISKDLEHAFYIFLACGVSALVSGKLLAALPNSRRIQVGASKSWGGYKHIWNDIGFRKILIMWMLLGTGNLLLNALRVDYLTNPKYHLGLGELEIALLATTIPNLSRLISSIVWGRLFDRINFFILRVGINVTFMLAFFSFFFSSSVLGLALGAILFGVAVSGGDVAWNLWTIRFAPKGLSSDYMSVHTSLTGLRGLIAPFLAFALAEKYSIYFVLYVSLALTSIASLQAIFDRDLRNMDKHHIK